MYRRHISAGMVLYARFYDSSGNVLITKSTGIKCVGKKQRKQEAYKKAEKLHTCLLNEKKSPVLIPYLESFWTENSPYVKGKRIVENKPLSEQYVRLNALGIKTHISTYKSFKKIRLIDLTPGMIDDWKIWMLEKGIGAKRVNDCMLAMRVVVKYKVSREELDKDPFQNIKKCTYKPKEKGILTIEEVKKLSESKEKDPRVKLAVLVAVRCGLRRGELRGMLWRNIDMKKGLLRVDSNFIDGEGLKGCKHGSNRTVIIPESAYPLLDEIKAISPQIKPDGFILISTAKEGEPCSNDILRKGLVRMLIEAGISREEQKERNLTLHGLRHTFITLARLSGVSDMVIQALAGHKSGEMMEHYSHVGQVIDFEEARKKLEGVPEPDNNQSSGEMFREA